MLVLFARIAMVAVLLVLGACPEERVRVPDGDSKPPRAKPQPPAATHTGIVSIQDMAIANLPQAGHGLTVQAFFTPLRASDFVEEVPGTPFGCRASAYELAEEPPPPERDQGELTLDGLRGGTIRCQFREGRGYGCPTASGEGSASVTSAGGASTYALEGSTLTDADVGRYLQISGASRPENNGAFAILSVAEPGTIALANTRATAEMFDAAYTVMAGAGPTPRDLYSPFLEDATVGVRLAAGGDRDFDSFEVEIAPGGGLKLDAASQRQIVGIEPNGEAIELGCDGEGGECGVAAASVIRISTTDGDTTGLPPVAMPPAQRWVVEIQCAFADAGKVRVPAEAMALIRAAHERSPITRIRTAFMREGYAVSTNALPRPANSAIVLVGHGVLGFSNPSRE